MRLIPVLLSVLFCGPALADGFGFRTPSGNIYCNGQLDGASISCVIVETSAPPPQARPAGCTANWGHSFSLDETGPVRMDCVGDGSLRKSTYSQVADYGVAGSFGRINCLSQTNGFQCTNASGHGFFLSRRALRVY